MKRSAREFVRVAESRLEVDRIPGRDSGAPTLVFLHEGLGCVALWRDFPETLVALTGCAGFAYSRSGYGRSDPCTLPQPLTCLHDEALEVLPRLIAAEGIGEHVLVGHSDGASIALIYAGAARRPDLLGLVAMAPHVFCEDLSVRSIRRAAEAFASGALRERLARYHGDNVDCAFRGWSDAWLDPGFRHWNIEQFLPAITVPLLVIQGEEDHYGTLAQVRSIERRSGGEVDVRVFPDCGHAPHQERTVECLDAIGSFIGRVVAPVD